MESNFIGLLNPMVMSLPLYILYYRVGYLIRGDVMSYPMSVGHTLPEPLVVS